MRPSKSKPNRDLTIKRLSSGGLITNYNCTSRCGHCLYACGPGWEKKYIDRKTTERNFRTVLDLGCGSVHIGGGEPFLNPEGLGVVLETARRVGLGIDYVETNSSWFKDPDSARGTLAALQSQGLRQLLVSMSPFHNEHVPWARVKGVLEACRLEGLRVFPWIPDFFPEIDAFDHRKKHRLSEYEDRYGPGYLRKIPGRYWVHFGGRAVFTFKDILGASTIEDILSRSRGGCGELLDVSHFHVDLFGNYIPGLCSGLAIRVDDLGKPLRPEDYPFLTTLFTSGVGGLLTLAQNNYGFEPTETYLNKCHLCVDIRQSLVLKHHVDTADLAPREFYSNLP